MNAALLTWVMTFAGQVPLPGTQPNELQYPTEPSSSCSCHESFEPNVFTEPGQSYRATMMALSGRDPLFRAAFEVARRDRPALTDLCLRCHTPAAWLQGRSEGDLDQLTEEDLEGVTCDICHRMVATDPPLIGDGQITLSQSTDRRSQRGSAPPLSGHGVQRDTYTSSSLMCATCHSLFNPLEIAYDADGRSLGVSYYEQRTFEEWRDSVFPSRDQGCVECHMRVTSGAAVRDGETYDDLRVHAMVGGNEFAARAVRYLNPSVNIALELGQLSNWVGENLAAAADLEIIEAPTQIQSGQPFEVAVRLTNRTGHKLPTGYPEGRRIYLEVSIALDGQGPVILSGAWNQTTGNVQRDPQLRTYEAEHGRFENGQSQRSRSLLLLNQILSDTRIPPEGFVPQHPDMVPSGRDYGAGPPYRHYDEHRYTFEAPLVSRSTGATVSIRAMYQTTDGEVVDFLLDAAAGTQAATDLERAWNALGRAPPREMMRAETTLTVQPQQTVATDGGIEDTGMGNGPTSDTGGGLFGCRCIDQPPARSSLATYVGLFGWVGAALGLALGRPRRRPRRKD